MPRSIILIYILTGKLNLERFTFLNPFPDLPFPLISKAGVVFNFFASNRQLMINCIISGITQHMIIRYRFTLPLNVGNEYVL